MVEVPSPMGPPRVGPMCTGTRDLIGNGANPPHPAWPGGARIVVHFVLNDENGSDYAIGQGDGRSDAFLTWIGSSPVPAGERDLAAGSMSE